MRKFVLLSLEKVLAGGFRPSNLFSVSKLHGPLELARYIEDRILDASIAELASYGPLKQLEFSCKYRGRRPTGKLPVPRPVIEQKSDLWVREGGRLALALDMPLDLAPISSALLSRSLYNRLGGVKPLELNQKMFATLLARAKKRGGKLTSVHLLDVREPAPLDVLQASGRAVESFPGFDRAIASGRKKRLGFHIVLDGERFSFWVADFGNGTLYSPPAPEPHHVDLLMRFFEEALKVSA